MVLIFTRLFSDADAATALRDAGLKATPQRLAILRSISGDETHPTAQELYERLQPEYPTLSVATIYNTLSALTRIDRVRPLELGGPVRFDPNVTPHDHAVCEACGKIRDVTPHDAASESAPRVAHAARTKSASRSKSKARAAAASSQHGDHHHNHVALASFRVRRVERIYRGLCASCAKTTSAVRH